jgi:hypothetical protein
MSVFVPNIVDETMKAEIDLEHVEKAMMFQSKEVTSCQQDEQIPQSDVCDDEVRNERDYQILHLASNITLRYKLM